MLPTRIKIRNSTPSSVDEAFREKLDLFRDPNDSSFGAIATATEAIKRLGFDTMPPTKEDKSFVLRVVKDGKVIGSVTLDNAINSMPSDEAARRVIDLVTEAAASGVKEPSVKGKEDKKGHDKADL